MPDYPAASPPGTASPKSWKDLSKEVEDRVAECRKQKHHVDRDIREGYFFAVPNKPRSISTQMPISVINQPQDASVLQISIGMEEAENFATTLIRSFMPEGQPWMNLQPSAFVRDENVKRQLKDKGKQDTKVVFDLIAESNFYAELSRILNPDGALGTFGMWIDRGNISEPVKCKGVPLREMEINVGPDGAIDDRFIIRHTKYKNVRDLVGKDITLSKKIEDKIKREPKSTCCVTWGFWRLWDKPHLAWKHVMLVDDEVIDEQEYEGAGTCPFIVVTFNREVSSAYGNGPLIKALPELRQLDEMAGAASEMVDLSLRPPMGYPDDSFANIADGVVPGGWYPLRVGSEAAVKKLYEPSKLDAAFFDQKSREDRVKRIFYNDFPQQRGDTPPTATQWIDEMSMAQRKIGTPGLAFWREGPAEFFLRFYTLCLEGGLCKRVTNLNNEMALVPDNPTRQAQNQQKVAMVGRLGQLAAGLFPEEFKVKIDGAATIDKCIEAMGLEDMMPVRNPQQIAQATQLISQVAGGNQPQTPGTQLPPPGTAIAQPPQPGMPTGPAVRAVK